MKEAVSNARFLQDNRVSAIGFSHKADYCAIATKKDHNVHVYKIGDLKNINSWTLLQEFKDHSQTVGDVEWSADNKIITSSHDRSVFIWKQVTQSKWQRMLVNIDIKLSILVSKWAPSCKKMALGSACSTLAIGYYNIHQNCWTIIARDQNSKNPISTTPIISLCFHPSSNIIAVGSADFKVKLVTVSFKKTKNEFIIQSNVEDNSYKGPFDKIDTLFDVILSLQNVGGWVNHLSFENDGNSLLVLPHTNHIKILELTDNEKVMTGEEDIRWEGLPFLSGYINKNKDLILGGFDKKVAKFVRKTQFTFDRFLEQNEKSGVQNKISKVSSLTRGIEKREAFIEKVTGDHEHPNAIKVLQVNGMPVSYDINGIVHFWSET